MAKNLDEIIKNQFESRKKYVSIGDIKSYEYNNKDHSEEQIRQIADSIKEYGFNTPLVIDKDGVLVVGHGRYEAAKLLGILELPVLVVDDLSEDEIREYRIMDNRITDMSIWNEDALGVELKELDNQKLSDMFVSFGFFNVTDQQLGDDGDSEDADIDNTYNNIASADRSEASDGIRKIELYFNDEEYIKIMDVFEKIMENGKYDNISELFIERLGLYFNKYENGN